MRILFTAVPAAGHVNPLLPLARAALAAGHQVALLTGGEMIGKVDAEIPILKAGPSIETILAEAGRRLGTTRDIRAPSQESDRVAQALETEVFAGARVDLAAPEALELAGRWQPDLIICENADMVGPLVAAATGVPWARVAYAVAMEDDKERRRTEKVASRYAERGLTPTPPIAYVDPCPPSLQRPGWQSPVHRIGIRPEPHRTTGPTSAVPQFPASPPRPLVVITLGTVFGTTDMLRAMIASLEPAGVNVISTLGRQFTADAADLERDWVKLVDYVPLDQLLVGVSVVVSVGGAGTTMGTLQRGIPMVMFPQGADQPRNTAGATRAGAAIQIQSPDETGAAVEKILLDPSFTERAQAVAEEMAAMRTTAEVLAELGVNRLGY